MKGRQLSGQTANGISGIRVALAEAWRILRSLHRLSKDR
jgi:hypothetical protein